jgi:cell division protein FtsL
VIRAVIVAVLFAAVFASALEIVTKRHASRKLFVELQELRKEQDELNRRWGQLLLEQATWGTRGRVEEIAREQLNMVAPPQLRVERGGP